MKNTIEEARIIITEINEELGKLKGKWELENKASGNLEIPENILDLEGVEYLLNLNIFEVLTVLSITGHYLPCYNMISKAEEYSEEEKAVYVEKGSEIIERLLGFHNAMGIDLAKAEEIDSEHSDLVKSSKWYIETLASKIGMAINDVGIEYEINEYVNEFNKHFKDKTELSGAFMVLSKYVTEWTSTDIKINNLLCNAYLFNLLEENKSDIVLEAIEWLKKEKQVFLKHYPKQEQEFKTYIECLDKYEGIVKATVENGFSYYENLVADVESGVGETS